MKKILSLVLALVMLASVMSVAAFGGYKPVMAAYEEALKEGYKFGPYGDALLML